MNQELERFDPISNGGRIFYEHVHRYSICRDQVVGKRVLDVGCGAGYGTKLLAEVADRVTGVDIDQESIEHARETFAGENLEFLAADCYSLPFADDHFDVVVANEMIEHIEDHDKFLQEVKRVLRPEGMLLVSTPNRPVYNRYREPNPYHVSEMELEEFSGLLHNHFGLVRMTGLRMALVSAGYQLSGGVSDAADPPTKTYRGSHASGPGVRVVDDGALTLSEPEYLLAACSDSSLEHAPTAQSIFLSADDDLWQEHAEVMAWASRLHEEDEALREELQAARSELEELRRHDAGDGAAPSVASTPDSFGDTQFLAVCARILGRLTGESVDAEHVSVVDALFSLSGRLLTQQLQLEVEERAARRADALTAQLARLQEERDQLELSLGVARAEQAAELAAHLEERDQLELSLGVARAEQAAELAAHLEERDQLELSLVDVRADLVAMEEALATFREDASDEASRVEEALGEALAEVNHLRGRLDELEAEKAAHVCSVAPARSDTAQERRDVARSHIENERARLASQLAAAHVRVTQELAAARETPVAVPGDRRSVTPMWGLRRRMKRWHPLRSTAIFDRDWVVAQLPQAKRVDVSNFLWNQEYFRVDPHPLFDSSAYLDKYPDVLDAGVSPLQHYLEYGWLEGRDPHPYFMNNWYLHQYPDVLESGLNPLEHYLRFGWREGRRPNPVFSPEAYLSRHPDIVEAGMEPLSHYVSYGRAEGRDVPCHGLERTWRSVVTVPGDLALIDHLLSREPLGAASPTLAPAEDLTEWPPAPLGEYWPPQTLRDFFIETNREVVLPLYWFLLSVMDQYSERPHEFPESAAFAQLLDRVRMLSTRLSSDFAEVAPDASIIIPAYNNFLDTFLCLVSVLESDSKFSFEVIVADDCSDDATADVISSVGGVVKHFRQEKNVGFLANCNTAAEAARGSYVVLLNNDTLVLPGWLDGLLGPLRTSAAVGLVGSKLINWDGSLQEAGGIFWEDGSAWNFGRGASALEPEYNYRKDVDYCSGASIAIPAEVWRRLSGFDPLFAPAYCEDADLAFRIREEGLRTIYSPVSEVIHHEGRSHGRDTSSGVKAYQVRNQQFFVDRWSATLAAEHSQNAVDVLEARDRSRGQVHVLVIDHYVPQWDQDAGSRTIYQYLQIFLDLGFKVTFWPDNLYRDPIYASALQEMGIEVIYGAKFMGGFESFIQERGDLYAAAFVSRPEVAEAYLPFLRKHTQARLLYYGHDLHFRRMEASRRLDASVSAESIEAMKQLELHVCRASDVIFYPDPDEVAYISDEVGPGHQVLANPVFVYEDAEFERAEERLLSSYDDCGQRLLFVGGFNHPPNADGILWFVSEVLPRVAEVLPDVTLEIVGTNPPAELEDFSSAGVSVLGRVSEERLLALYSDCSAVVAPLRYGAGVKGKVIEAMAYGLPVVTTTVGAQGIDSFDQVLFVGDSPEDMARELVRALSDRQNAVQRAQGALDFVREHYGRSSMSNLLHGLVVGTDVPGPAHVGGE